MSDQCVFIMNGLLGLLMFLIHFTFLCALTSARSVYFYLLSCCFIQMQMDYDTFWKIRLCWMFNYILWLKANCCNTESTFMNQRTHNADFCFLTAIRFSVYPLKESCSKCLFHVLVWAGLSSSWIVGHMWPQMHKSSRKTPWKDHCVIFHEHS